MRQLRRSESPYQDMNSAKSGTSPSQPKNFGLKSTSSSGGTTQTPNNDIIMHVTPGGSVVYRSREPACSVEGQSPNQQELARSSVTLPENALPTMANLMQSIDLININWLLTLSI